MAIGGRKPKKGSLGTSFIIEKIPGLKRISCSNCTNYSNDKSCFAKSVMMSEIGYDFWKQCDEFELSSVYETEENILLAERTRKRVEHTHKIDKSQKGKQVRKARTQKITVMKIKDNKSATDNKPVGKKVISRATVQEMQKKGIGYQAIADHFGVDKDLIRKISMGFYGTGYMVR